MTDESWSTNFVRSLFFAYPRRSAIASFCLILSGLAEGVGVASLLPVLYLVLGRDPYSGKELGSLVAKAFSMVGLEPTFEILLVLMVCMMLVKGVLVLLSLREVGYTVAHVEADLRLSLIRSLMNARWQHFVTLHDGAIANAITNEAERAAYGYRRICFIIGCAVQLLVYAFISLVVSWQMTIFAAVAGLTVAALLTRFVRITREAGISQTNLLRSVSARLVDGLRCLKPLKAMACEQLLGPFLESEINELKVARRKEIFGIEARHALNEPVVTVLLALGLFMAVTYWNADLEAMIVLGLVFWRGLGRVDAIQGQIQELARVESALRSLRTTTEQARQEKEKYTGKTQPSLRTAIALRDVSFSYSDRSVTNNLTLTIPVNSFTALMGPSGIGKTTLADIVAGLLPPQSGLVCVDGVALSDLDMRAWRSMIGYVPQDTVLFHDSVFVNVALGSRDVTVPDVEAALKSAEAWDFVSEMPQGIHTLVGERGSMLSGGQRQRIAIARALVRKPKLLILDEVTSALDPETETAICATLQKLKGTCTIFAISHQRALVNVADHVYVMSRNGLDSCEPNAIEHWKTAY
ncbi:MAG: ABC transporter ATP-binding protein [Desulfomonile tiedjei]|uniref:ABC transporter ATP-binding protein n=1 Tax=Desulfomonile tiedjei TaxID=2358 RepID=A0A9D6V9L8_9BACT|nr:ABC transporter ATP-binding protein [Desulfomonile tiedjei]